MVRSGQARSGTLTGKPARQGRTPVNAYGPRGSRFFPVCCKQTKAGKKLGGPRILDRILAASILRTPHTRMQSTTPSPSPLQRSGSRRSRGKTGRRVSRAVRRQGSPSSRGRPDANGGTESPRGPMTRWRPDRRLDERSRMVVDRAMPDGKRPRCGPEVEPMHLAPLVMPQRDSALRGYPARRSSPEWAETRQGFGGAWRRCEP
jgi:hypothetical protein